MGVTVLPLLPRIRKLGELNARCFLIQLSHFVIDEVFFPLFVWEKKIERDKEKG